MHVFFVYMYTYICTSTVYVPQVCIAVIAVYMQILIAHLLRTTFQIWMLECI